ncbi:hypothetical protein NMG60_11022532 [Bertholletia excelsa]
MEGVGARLGRSSTRYGPTSTVFSGPVRKWKKKWVHISPPLNNASSNNHSQSTTTNQNGTTVANGNNNGSHLLLYKWTPLTPSQNGNNNSSSNDDKSSDKDVATDTTASAAEEPPRRKFKYIPIAVLEEQKNETAEYEAVEKVDDEAKPSETNTNAVEPTAKNDGLDEKPDINDLPMEESQPRDDNPLSRQDLNESTLDLSLGLKAHDGDHGGSDSRTDQMKEG